jgi:hypothetical protein
MLRKNSAILTTPEPIVRCKATIRVQGITRQCNKTSTDKSKYCVHCLKTQTRASSTDSTNNKTPKVANNIKLDEKPIKINKALSKRKVSQQTTVDKTNDSSTKKITTAMKKLDLNKQPELIDITTLPELVELVDTMKISNSIVLPKSAEVLKKSEIVEPPEELIKPLQDIKLNDQTKHNIVDYSKMSFYELANMLVWDISDFVMTKIDFDKMEQYYGKHNVIQILNSLKDPNLESSLGIHYLSLKSNTDHVDKYLSKCISV